MQHYLSAAETTNLQTAVHAHSLDSIRNENTYIVFKDQQNSSTVWTFNSLLTLLESNDVSFQQAVSKSDLRSKLIQKVQETFNDACKKASDA